MYQIMKKSSVAQCWVQHSLTYRASKQGIRDGLFAYGSRSDSLANRAGMIIHVHLNQCSTKKFEQSSLDQSEAVIWWMMRQPT